MKRKPAGTYKLPDGSYTEDVAFYCRVWRELADDCAEIVGGDLCGFNPGITFVREGVAVALSTETAKRIAEAARELRALRLQCGKES